MTNSRMAIIAVVLGVCWSAWAAEPRASSIDCTGHAVCRDLMSRIALRVLAQREQPIFASMNASGPVTPHRVQAFQPLYVFDKVDFTRPGSDAAVGWYRVGLNPREPVGYVSAANVVEWRIPILATYADRKDPLDPVAFFGGLSGIEKAIGGAAPALNPGELLKEHTRAQGLGVVAHEPEGRPVSGSGAALLPVVQSIDIESFGVDDGWLLQVGLPTTAAVGIGRILCPATGCSETPTVAPVEFLPGRQPPPESIDLAWTADFDLAKRDRKVLALHVLLMQSQLTTLKDDLTALLSELQLARLDVWLDRGARVQPEEASPRSPEEQLKHDQHKADLERPLLSLLPAWIQALPRRSILAGLTKGQLGKLSPIHQGKLEHRLLELISDIRQALARTEQWVSPPGVAAKEDERLIVWSFANLP